MRKRYFISAGIMAASLGLALVILAVLPSGPGVTKTNFSRIEKGMTLEEVEAVLGRAADGEHVPIPVISAPIPCPPTLPEWVSSDGSRVIVEFSDGLVTDAYWQDSTETIMQKLRRWLHL